MRIDKSDKWAGIDEKPDSGHYPSMAEVKSAVATELRESGKSSGRPRHPRMPSSLSDAVDWLLGLCEKPSRGEAPMAKNSANGTFWIWPYLARVKFQTNCFMHADKAKQDMIIDCAAEGVFWRGESKDELMTIYAEFEKMREVGVDAYRAKLKGLIPKSGNKKWNDNDRARYASLSRAEKEMEES